MTGTTCMKNGGELIVESLIALGASKSFGIPGESYLAVLDALYDWQGKLDFVLCRNEGGAAYMAAAHGKLTGSPGICFVTRGPGVTNASVGLHTAMQDSAPMILFVGQVGTDLKEREAFQEINYRAVFGTMVKWATEIDRVERIPEMVSRAWVTATTGRPGPVVIALPEDMLTSETDAKPLANAPAIAEPAANAKTHEKVADLLKASKRPLIITGGCNWTAKGKSALEVFAEQSNIPTLVAFRYQDRFNNLSPVYAGEAGVGMPANVRKLIQECDTILAINIRFGEMTTDAYTLLDVPSPDKTLIHVHPSDGEIGKIYQPTLGIHAGPNAFTEDLQSISGDWSNWTKDARQAYEAGFNAPEQPSPVDMVKVSSWLRETLPEDVIITNGAGNFSVWPNKFLQYGPKARLLAPQSGSMGYGLPAAIAAKIEHPEKTVVCFAGDGDFQMNCQELATALQSDAQPIVLIINNGTYGTIRAHQEREYPGRVSGTDMMKNPDFVALAKAYDFHAERVEKTEDFADAFNRALLSKTGAVLDIVVSAEAITPRTTLSEIRAKALAEQT